MEEDKKEVTTTISRSSTMTLGLAIMLSGFLFYGGVRVGNIESNQLSHEAIDMHQGAKDNFVPRNEIEILMRNINTQLQEIKKEQNEIFIILSKQ